MRKMANVLLGQSLNPTVRAAGHQARSRSSPISECSSYVCLKLRRTQSVQILLKLFIVWTLLLRTVSAESTDSVVRLETFVVEATRGRTRAIAGTPGVVVDLHIPSIVDEFSGTCPVITGGTFLG